jgi:hypothetical protein
MAGVRQIPPGPCLRCDPSGNETDGGFGLTEPERRPDPGRRLIDARVRCSDGACILCQALGMVSTKGNVVASTHEVLP